MKLPFLLPLVLVLGCATGNSSDSTNLNAKEQEFSDVGIAATNKDAFWIGTTDKGYRTQKLEEFSLKIHGTFAQLLADQIDDEVFSEKDEGFSLKIECSEKEEGVCEILGLGSAKAAFTNEGGRDEDQIHLVYEVTVYKKVATSLAKHIGLKSWSDKNGAFPTSIEAKRNVVDWTTRRFGREVKDVKHQFKDIEIRLSDDEVTIEDRESGKTREFKSLSKPVEIMRFSCMLDRELSDFNSLSPEFDVISTLTDFMSGSSLSQDAGQARSVTVKNNKNLDPFCVVELKFQWNSRI